jgi:hypothetical protein
MAPEQRARPGGALPDTVWLEHTPNHIFGERHELGCVV